MSHIYPEMFRIDPGLPSAEHFSIGTVDGRVGMGVRTKRRIERGTLVARFTGQLSSQVLQHTLQISPQTHLHDPYFVGLLSHSCAPNCVLDMQRLEIWSLTDIDAGEALTIDYAATEDVLHRQFACGCGAASCRRWVTGRREKVDEIGRAYLEGLSAKKVRRIVSRGLRKVAR